MLAACGKSTEPAPPPPTTTTVRDAAPAWPVAPAPTLPPELAHLAWPPTLDEVRPFEDGMAAAGGTAYGVTIPTIHPHVWLAPPPDLRTLEAAWGKLARAHGGYPTWWNPATHVRARFDVPHPTPSLGRGLDLSPYVSTIDRIANIDELVLDAKPGTIYVPPGEWDPGPVTITITDANPGLRARFTVRADGPPVDQDAVLAKLREIYGEPTLVDEGATYLGGRVTARLVTPVPAIEITYVTR